MPEYRTSGAFLDEQPSPHILSVAPAIPSSRDPRWQAPGRASLVPAHAGHRNQLEGVFPWRRKDQPTDPLPSKSSFSACNARPVHTDGKVEDRRGSLGPMANAPFPIPAHQTERADFRHSAFRLASTQGPRWSAA